VSADSDSYKVLILGLDGATFDLMLPLVEQGQLPCLGKLIREGSMSPLRSTIPPVTPCAWSSFMTGKNPGKHGLFDFVEPLPTGRGFRFTNASSRHAESLWAYLSRLGRRVGVMNVPMTYPPERVNGYLISGLDTPDEHSRYTYPESLKQELRRESIEYRVDIRHMGNMRTLGRRRRRFRELLEIETIRTRALKHLLRRQPSDFTMLVYSATDQVQHHFWHDSDPAHPKHDPEGGALFRDAIRDTYIHLDNLIASILEETGDDTIVMIMSDHGFGPTSDVRLRLNQAFERANLLAFEREGASGRAFRSSAALLDRVLRATLSPGVKRMLASLTPRLRVWFENLDEARVDWSRTSAFTNEVSRCFPTVWINHEDGAVGEADYVQAVEAAERALSGLIDPATGRPAISRVYRTRDLYHGPFVDRAPDLIPSWWEDGFLLEQSIPGGPADRLVEHSRGPLKNGVEFAGSHKLDGVFIMAGGPARCGHAFNGAEIIDVAPTVLYLMGLPIPGDMDGRPLLEAIDPAFAAAHSPRFDRDEAPPPPEGPSLGEEAAYTADEAEMVAKRLQSLGYID
jgi:predicted AlkP superfamily phosphohydrolase/phosphomutase